MKTIALALVAALSAAPVLAEPAVTPIAGPAVVTGNSPMIGAHEAVGPTSRITSPIAWIVHVAPLPAETAAPIRSAGVVTAPAATSGASDIASAALILPVALR